MTVYYHGMVKYINVSFWEAIKQAWRYYREKYRTNKISLIINEGGLISLTITL